MRGDGFVVYPASWNIAVNSGSSAFCGAGVMLVPAVGDTGAITGAVMCDVAGVSEVVGKMAGDATFNLFGRVKVDVVCSDCGGTDGADAFASVFFVSRFILRKWGRTNMYNPPITSMIANVTDM